MTARTATANAMSVAVGMAQPRIAPSPTWAVKATKISGGHHHAADRGGDGQRGTAGVAQVTGDELALEFEADDEEEDGQQPVGGPGAQTQVEVQAEAVGADVQVAERLIGRRPRRVGPCDGDDGGDQQ